MNRENEKPRRIYRKSKYTLEYKGGKLTVFVLPYGLALFEYKDNRIVYLYLIH